MNNKPSISSVYRAEQFALPEGTIYLDGNSLGAMPLSAQNRAKEVVEKQWAQGLITSWNRHDWIDLPETVGNKIGTLVGAAPGQVICCDTISVNLFKVVSAALTMQTGRSKVLTTIDNFPSDIYTLEGVVSRHNGFDLTLIDETDILAQLSEDVAVLVLTQVNFRSGQKLDMAAITRAAHALGILVVWDLAHSAGAFKVELDECQVDFAVGCTYKYLNGGPGSPGFIYVSERHQQDYRQPISGWMGHASPFEFSPNYVPAESIKQNLSGTPGVIGMSVLDAALNVFDEIDMKDVEQASQELSVYFLAQMDSLGLLSEFDLVSPKEVSQRGSQLAFSHPQSYAICQAWIDAGVIADFRAPSILRIGFTPLYLSQGDLDTALQRLFVIMSERRYMEPQYQVKNKVT